MIYYVEIHKETAKRNVLEIMNEFNKTANTRSTRKYQLHFYMLTKNTQ